MGKKSRQKRERRAEKSRPVAVDEGAAEVTGSGDLRLVEAHVEHWVAGVPEAEVALKMLGRDAAQAVIRIGERLENDKVVDFGKRLVAVKPQVETNLYALRRESVLRYVERASAEAPPAAGGPALPRQALSVSVFDPARVVDALSRGGRPRAEPARVDAGDIAVFSLDPLADAEVEILLEPPPEGTAAGVGTLLVDSGVVFVGPPEAADGPRLGDVRLDPFRTRLDELEARGGFRRVPPARYEVAMSRDGAKVRIHLYTAERGQPGGSALSA